MLIICFCVTNFPQIWQLWTTRNVYYLTASEGQESWEEIDWLIISQGLKGFQSKRAARAVVSSNLSGSQRTCFEAPSLRIGIPIHVGFSLRVLTMWELVSPKASKERGEKGGCE